MFQNTTASQVSVWANVRYVGLALGLAWVFGWLTLWPVQVLATNTNDALSRVRADKPLETCFATPNHGTTVYSSTTAQAARDAIAVATTTVKLAGYCPGVVFQGGTTQTLLITQSLTLSGGYTLTNWLTSDPHANPTTLDAGNMGRVISAPAASLVLRDLILANGTITGNGAGLYAQSGVSLTAVTLLSNTASANGGGLFVNTGTVVVANSLFLGNRALANGGGIYLGSAGSSSLMINSLFVGNRGTGTALYVSTTVGSLNILHSTVVSPSGASGAAIYVAGGKVYLTNTIVTSHSLGINGVGGSTVATRTLFFGNVTNVSGLVTSTGAVVGYPGFIDPINGDFHIVGSSVARNAGITPTLAVPLDADGDARSALDGYDIGYDEHAPVSAITPVGWPTFVPIATPAMFMAQLWPATAGRPFTYTWQATGQSQVVHTGSLTTTDAISFTWGTGGPQTITVVVANAGGTTTNTLTTTVDVPRSEISGMVFNDLNVNGVLDGSDLPMAGIAIQLTQDATPVVTTMSAVDGSYKFDNLALGNYTVLAETSPGYAATTLNPASININSPGVYSADFGFFATLANPAIVLTKTVGLIPSACAATSSLNVVGPTAVTYCYTVRNTGNVTFTTHTVSDSQLGNVTPGYTYTLAPGATTFLTRTTTVSNTIASSGVWTATNGVELALASSTTVVTVTTPAPALALTKTVGLNPSVCATTNTLNVLGPTAVTYCYTAQNTGNITFTTHWLTDTQMGTIYSTQPITLAPGGVTFVTRTTTLSGTTVNTATWAATNGLYPATTSRATTVTVTPVNPALVLTKTVGTAEGVCAITPAITVVGQTNVTYCYQARNTGNITFSLQTLVDSRLGPLVSLPVSLIPGDILTVTSVTSLTTPGVITNTAVWTATNGAYTATASSLATVTVLAPNPVLVLTNTVGTNPNICAATPTLEVLGPTAITYCYSAHNTGNITFTAHSLWDAQLGVISSTQFFSLTPGTLNFVTRTITVTNSITSTAFWTASNGVYTTTVPNTTSVTVRPNAGTIIGAVHNDSNGDGLRQLWELGLPNVVISLTNAQLQVYTTTTTASGLYTFTNVITGIAWLTEKDALGYVSTTPNEQSVLVVAGGVVTANFGDQPIGQVSGVVYNDANSSGAQDPWEPGLSGVTISLIGAVTTTTTTATNGTYTFTNVAPGAYWVRETDPISYASTTNNQVRIWVAASGSAFVNFGDQLANTFSGLVFEDVDGNGLPAPTEVGRAGLVITLTRNGLFFTTTTTNGSGLYSVANLLQGNYTACATLPSGYLFTTASCRGVYISNGAGAANFGLLASGLVVGSVFNDTNGNGRQDLLENGLSEVWLELRPSGQPVPVASAATNGLGDFAIAASFSGTYEVCIGVPPNFMVRTLACQNVGLGNGQSAAVNFGLVEQNAIVGVVFREINGNMLPDAGELGLGGVTVTITSTGGLVTTTVTAGDGSYHFSRLNLGNYQVRETVPTSFTLLGQNPRSITLTTSNRSQVTHFAHHVLNTVNGVVFEDQNGNRFYDLTEPGVAGATMMVYGTGFSMLVTATTPSNGVYELSFPASSGIVLHASAPPAGYFGAYTITTWGLARVNFGFLRTGSLGGMVYDDFNGNGLPDVGERGLAGVQVGLWQGSNLVFTATTGLGGTYQFLNVPPNTYVLKEANPPGYNSVTPDGVTVVLSPGAAATVNFGDWAKGWITGIVFDDQNGDGLQQLTEGGLGGVALTLTSLTTTLTTTLTAADGHYAFAVPFGIFRVVEADPVGYTSITPNQRDVVVAPNSSASANFGDVMGGTVVGAVFNDLDGNGLRENDLGIGGVTIVLSGPVVLTTATASDGNYNFSAVVPGNYLVNEVDPPGFASTTANSRPVVVTLGGSASASFGERPQNYIGGVVYEDRDGNGQRSPGEVGLSGVLVTLSGPTGTVATLTNSEGGYEFPAVPLGVYNIVETDLASFASTTPNTVVVSIALSDTATANFGDVLQHTVGGMVWDDLDGNGQYNNNESGIGGVPISLTTLTGVFVLSTTTLGNGTYQFVNLPPDHYRVHNVGLPGYVSLNANLAAQTVFVSPGNSSSANFGIRRLGTVRGLVWADLDGDGVRSLGEMGVGGAQVVLSGTVRLTTTTTGDGLYLFVGPPSDTYQAFVAPVNGFANTTPNIEWVIASPAANPSAHFGLQRRGTIAGRVFGDTNGNHQPDSYELGLSGVVITLQNYSGAVVAITETVGDGTYQFRDLVPDRYTVQMATPAGLAPTTPVMVILGMEEGGVRGADFGVAWPNALVGQVFVDDNRNGQQDANENGINGATLKLFKDYTLLGQATTTGSGNFAFTGLQPGTYTLVKLNPASWFNGRAAISTSLAGDTTPSQIVVVVGASGSTGTSFGVSAPNAFRSVSGFAWKDLDGDGLPGSIPPDGFSSPEVKLIYAAPDPIDDIVVDNSPTILPLGTYLPLEVTDLNVPDPGSFYLQMDPSAYTAPWLETTGLLGRTNIFVLASNPTSGPHDVTMNIGMTPIGSPNGAIAGQVTALVNAPLSGVPGPGSTTITIPGDHQVHPLPGVTIQLWATPPPHTPSQTPIETKTTNATGYYFFNNLTPGTYWVEMLQPPYGNTGSNYWPASFPWNEVLVADGQISIAPFAVQYDPCVLGFVYSDLNLDGQYSAGEPPLSGVTVRLKNPSGVVVSTTTSASDGFYLLLDVPLGTYEAEVMPPANWNAVTENPVALTLAHPEIGANVSFGLAPTTGVGGLLLAPGLRPASGVGAVQGQVVGRDGRGLAGVPILVQGAAGNTLGQTSTIANGTYFADNIPVGAVTVVANIWAGYVRYTLNHQAVVVNNGQAAVANFVSGPKSRDLQGKVFNDSNGNGKYDEGEEGFGGLPVTLQPLGASSQVFTTTTRGEYFFSAPPGLYQLTVNNPPHYQPTTPHVVAGWGPALINFGYHYQNSQTKVAGVIYNDANGNGQREYSERGVSGANLRLYTLTGTLVMTATTTGLGNYQFENLAPAAYQVVVMDDTGFLATTPATVTVWASPEAVVTADFGRRYVGLTLGAGKVVGLVFQDLDGDQRFSPGEPPLAGVPVQVWTGSTLVTNTRTLGNGSYSFDLAAGEYTLELVMPAGFAPTTLARWPISLAAEQLTSLPLGVRPLNTLSGGVFFDQNGDGAFSRIDRSAGGLTVTLWLANGSVLSTTTSVDGFYVFNPLADGTYTVTLELPAGLGTTTPLTQVVNLNPTSHLTPNFGVQLLGALGGFVYRDLNGDGVFNPAETGLSGVHVAVVGLTLTHSLTTTNDGWYQLWDMPPGVYTITETDPTGFTSLVNTEAITLSSMAFVNFGDRPSYTMSGNLYYDADLDGQQATGEPGFGGGVVQLKNTTTGQVVSTTRAHSNGAYQFQAVPTGHYTVEVIEPLSFLATTPRQVVVSLTGNGSVTVNFGLWNNTNPRRLYLPFIKR